MKLNNSIVNYMKYLGYDVNFDETGTQINLKVKDTDKDIGFISIIDQGIIPVLLENKGLKVLSNPVDSNMTNIIYWLEEIVRKYEATLDEILSYLD